MSMWFVNHTKNEILLSNIEMEWFISNNWLKTDARNSSSVNIIEWSYRDVHFAHLDYTGLDEV